MKKRRVAGGLALGCGAALVAVCIAQADSASMAAEPLPSLQAISIENARDVVLLRVLTIPEFKSSPVSQNSVAFSPDGRFLVAAGGRNRVPVWNVNDGTIAYLLYDEPERIVACAFSPDGEIVASGGFDGEITLWDATTGDRIGVVGEHSSSVWDLDFSPDGQQLVSCSLEHDTRLWDVARREMIWSYRGVGGYLSVAFAPSGETIAVGSLREQVSVLEATGGERAAHLTDPQEHIGDVHFSPSGEHLAAGTDDDRIYLWDAVGLSLVTRLEGASGICERGLRQSRFDTPRVWQPRQDRRDLGRRGGESACLTGGA